MIINIDDSHIDLIGTITKIFMPSEQLLKDQTSVS